MPGASLCSMQSSGALSLVTETAQKKIPPKSGQPLHTPRQRRLRSFLCPSIIFKQWLANCPQQPEHEKMRSEYYVTHALCQTERCASSSVLVVQGAPSHTQNALLCAAAFHARGLAQLEVLRGVGKWVAMGSVVLRVQQARTRHV